MNDRIEKASGEKRFMTFDLKDDDFGVERLKLHFNTSEVAKIQTSIDEENGLVKMMNVLKSGVSKGQPNWDDQTVDDFVARHMIDLQKFAAIYMGVPKDEVEKMFEMGMEEGRKKIKGQ